MAAKLKVFVTSDGLTDYVVATTSKPKALAAWGAHQDLFKTGLAHQTDDRTLVKAASAQPGEVLRRAAGSRATLAKMKPVKRAEERPVGPSKAVLKRIATAERKLAEAEAAHVKAQAALEAQRAKLDARWEKDREGLQAALSAAKRALP